MSSTPSTSLALFSSASTSFRNTQYPLISGSSAASSRSSFPVRGSARNHDSLAMPQSMDPQPTDPNVFFIHPPFNTFPNAHMSPDGLTYNLMAENLEWFLDPSDFASQGNNTNPDAIPYPPHLEPPRGWCPAKKKDLKERGGDSWPEGEEPRLRCTFCRRTYAGVNAKSMWRRHVFEKHKIAMSNRRDGNSDRPRGRGTGKENKHLVSVKHSESHDGLISIVVTPQDAPEISSHKSRFRSGKVQDSIRKRDGGRNEEPGQLSLPFTPRKVRRALSCQSDSEVPCKPTTPPLTPHMENSSDVLGSDGLSSTPPVILHPIIPESPYNPLQTPSFRHSSPRLPFAQPWRFPSPSHPLHSSSRELSLTMLTGSLGTPLIKPTPALGVSPLLALHSSPPSSVTQLDSSTTETPAKPYLPFAKPSNLARFLDQASSPLGVGKPHGNRQRIASSPLPFPRYRTPKLHSRQPSDTSESWLPDERLASSLSSLPMGPPTSDPFVVYDSWPTPGTTPITPLRVVKPTVEGVSPVVRSGSLAGDVILLEPFRDQAPSDDMDDDLKAILLSSPTAAQGDHQSDGKRSTPPLANLAEFNPPLKKKRRMSPEDPDV